MARLPLPDSRWRRPVLGLATQAMAGGRGPVLRRYYSGRSGAYSQRSYLAMVLGGSMLAYGAAIVADGWAEGTGGRARWASYQGQEAHWRPASVGQERRRHQGGGAADRALLWWSSLPQADQTIYALIALNGAVFCGWRIPSMSRFMGRFFLHSIRSHPITMATSTFSHATALHLALNMVALYSFGGIIHRTMGREQFLAFYMTSGLCASGGSHLVKALRRDPTPSLGASGAIFGLAGATCAAYPSMNVSLIFIPFASAPISHALPAMMAIDVAGLVSRWTSFDHAAHLAGVLSGGALFFASTRLIWPHRRRIQRSLFGRGPSSPF